MDTVITEDLLATAIVGINEDERRNRQDVLTNILIHVDIVLPGKSGSNYRFAALTRRLGRFRRSLRSSSLCSRYTSLRLTCQPSCCKTRCARRYSQFGRDVARSRSRIFNSPCIVYAPSGKS